MRGLKWAAWAVAALAMLLGAAWLVLPGVVQSQLQARGSEALGRALHVQRVEFAPFSLALTLHGLSLAGRDGTTAPQFEIARVRIDADLRSIVKLAPVIESIEVDAPRLHLTRMKDGGLDIDDIVERLRLRRPAPVSSSDQPLRFALFNLQLRDGELRFDDQQVARAHTVDRLQIGLPFLSNLPADVAVHVQPRVAFVLDGKTVELRGRALPFSDDHASEMAIKLVDVDLAPWWAYVPSSLPLRPEGGVLSADLALQFAQPSGQVARVGLTGRTSLQRLMVKNRAGATLLGWQSLAVELSDIRPLQRQIALGAVALDGAEFDVRREAGGALEWAQLGTSAAPPVPAAPASAPAARPPPWQVAVSRIDVRDARVRWQDAAVRPATALAVEALSMSSQGLRWPVVGRVPLQAAARVMSGARTVAQWKLSGEASDHDATLRFDLDEVQLAAAAPYLRGLLRPSIDGRGRVAGSLEWAVGERPRLQVQLDALQVDALRLTEPGAREPALRWSSAAVKNTQVDLLARKLGLGHVSLTQPVLRLQRERAGALNLEHWLVATSATQERPAPALQGESRETPWRLDLSQFQLDGGRILFNDAAVRPDTPVALDLGALRVGVRDLSWPASARPARIELAAQLRVPPEPGAAAEPPGRLQARGTLKLAPLAWRGRVDLERWPVAAFEPYFAPLLPVHLHSAELGVRGEIDLQLAQPGLTLAAQADVLLADVQLHARPKASGASDELMSWQSLSLKPVQVALAPGTKPRIEIGEVQWSDFYSRLVISEDGRFNLRDVGAAAPAPDAAASAPTAAAVASAASAPATPPKELPFELIVGGTRLVNGRVDFTDRFIRPNYSAALSELNGTLGRVDSRTRDMATLDLRGRAAGTALLEIRGALNPTADPPVLDISARATDLELAPLTPYAGKYAGYAIERGKLSMDVAYRIDPDGKLEAKNQVILNQLTFGEKIDSPEATKLPVRLAVALLTDRNGVIDLDLPVSGSINDPKFSIWGIVWKLVGNLLVKAFTAPFSLLAGGATEDLSVVQFVPGTATIAPGSTAVVDRVARALAERPALRMTVTGAADPVSERDAIRSAALEARIVAEQRRDLARAGAAAGAASAPWPELTGAARTLIVKRLYGDARLPDKPRNLIGMAKDLPLAEMETLLKGAVVVSSDSARELAIQRGLAVRDALIGKGLPSERLFLGAPKVHVPGEDDAAWTPRVQLLLNGP